MFDSIKSLLESSSLKQPIKRGVRAAVITEAARDVLEFIFPSNVAERIFPLSFKNGYLTLAVKNFILIQEIKIREQSIIKLVNEQIGENLVKNIRIKFARQDLENMLGC